MTTPREEAIRAERRRAARSCAAWAVIVPAATLPLAAVGPIVGIPLFLVAAPLAIRTRRAVARPFAHGEFHWRLAAEAFREAIRPPLVAGGLMAVVAAASRAAPGSPALAVSAVALGVVSVFSTAYALGAPRDVVFDHALGVLAARPVGRSLDYGAMLLLMRRAEDVDRRAIARLGESLIAPAVESLPPYGAAFDAPPDAAALRDRLAELADSFAADPDPELAEALRGAAAVVEAARAAGVRCRLASVPPYPSDQAFALMGSAWRYA